MWWNENQSQLNPPADLNYCQKLDFMYYIVVTGIVGPALTTWLALKANESSVKNAL